jgi:hypothetical protein
VAVLHAEEEKKGKNGDSAWRTTRKGQRGGREGEGSGTVRRCDAHAVGGGRSLGAAAAGCTVWARTGERPLGQGRRRLMRRPCSGLNEFKKIRTNSNSKQISSNCFRSKKDLPEL